MDSFRTIGATFTSKQVMEGAGVVLRRGFANIEAHLFDPFLLFDDFSSKVPEHYEAGFPWHPHRGMETVTYILDGAVRHKDSLGNEGVIEGGSLQWMTAGRGIIHEEMPESIHGIRGFQLWINLPKAQKMQAPRYQDHTPKTIPSISVGQTAHVLVIAGNVAGVSGPLEAAGSPTYLDVTLVPNGEITLPIACEHTAFVYVIDGALGVSRETPYAPGVILLLNNDGNAVHVEATDRGARFLLIAGTPLKEPIAWRGPVVMNTDEELSDAFREIREGTFVKP